MEVEAALGGSVDVQQSAAVPAEATPETPEVEAALAGSLDEQQTGSASSAGTTEPMQVEAALAGDVVTVPADGLLEQDAQEILLLPQEALTTAGEEMLRDFRADLEQLGTAGTGVKPPRGKSNHPELVCVSITGSMSTWILTSSISQSIVI
eukprot:2522395-Amphidinium_carterae.1